MRALKVLLEGFGVKIDPNEVERVWLQAKDALPQLAMAFDEMNKRQARMESKLDEILARQKLTEFVSSPIVTTHNEKLSDVMAMEMNGVVNA
jgi:hypothetical protein